jgi:hypothetical protein
MHNPAFVSILLVMIFVRSVSREVESSTYIRSRVLGQEPELDVMTYIGRVHLSTNMF